MRLNCGSGPGQCRNPQLTRFHAPSVTRDNRLSPPGAGFACLSPTAGSSEPEPQERRSWVSASGPESLSPTQTHKHMNDADTQGKSER